MAWLLASATAGAATPADCEAFFSREDWNRALQCTSDLPHNTDEYRKLRVRSAIALFEKRLPLSALIVIGDLKTKDTASLTDNEIKLLELAALFQKKVPAPLLPANLEQANLNHVPSYLEDEVRYAKARFALSKGEIKDAAAHFTSIRPNSRFYLLASYHLGALALREKNLPQAEKHFGELFRSQVMTQPSEVWQQMVTQFTLHWGASFHVALDADRILKNQELGELGLLAFARLSYAKKDFGRALQHYEKIPPESRYRSTAALERIWTLIQMNRQGEAQSAAAELAKDTRSFESFKAEPLSALILTEQQKTKEARETLMQFDKRVEELSDGLKLFVGSPRTAKLPPSLQEAMDASELRETLDRFEADLDRELAELTSDSMRPYSAFQELALKLTSWKTFAADERVKLKLGLAKNQLASLPAIRRQSKLMLAETYLEDREILRKDFLERSDRNQPEVQKDHDRRLAELIEKVLNLIETSFPSIKHRPAGLEFRQVELMWELASAKLILSTTDNNPQLVTDATKLRRQAVSTMSRLLAENPNLNKRADALFFKGFAELELQSFRDGYATLAQFGKEYPEHEHAPDAFRILGDQAFDSGQYEQAVGYFKKIIAFGDSPIVGYAFYKAGWSYYTLADYPRALKHLELAISWADKTGKLYATFNLTRESRRDYVAIYAENENVDKAPAEFARVFKEDARDTLWELGRELDKNGQFEAASKIYRKLYAESTTEGDKVALQTHLFYDYYRLRRWSQLEQELATSPLPAKPYTEEGKEEVEYRTREIAMGQHFEFQKDSSPGTLNRLEAVDRYYLKFFGDVAASQPVRYELGLLLLNRQRYAEAITELKAHWEQHKGSLKEPLKEQALRNLLFALERKESKTTATGSMGPDAETLLTMSAEYRALYEKNPNARIVASLRPSIFYKYDQVDKGFAESEALLQEKAGDKVAAKAFQDLKVAHFQRKDWAKTVAWCDTKLADDKFAPRRDDLVTLRGEAMFFWAESLGERVEAAQKFETLAADRRHANLRDKAAFRAFAIYDKEGRKKDAARLLEVYLAQAKPAPELSSWTSLGAVLYQEAGDFEKAQAMWRRYLDLPASPKDRELYLQAKWNFARISFAVGRRQEAIAMMNELLAESKSNPTQRQQVAEWLDKQRPGGRRDIAQSSTWDRLTGARAAYEKRELPKGKKPTERIAAGGKELASLVKSYVDFSKTTEATVFHRAEAACSLPLIYQSYSEKILRLGRTLNDKAKESLAKIAAPITQKSAELAKTCLDEAQAVLHTGPVYENVRRQFAPLAKGESEKWAGLLERLSDPRVLVGLSPTQSEKEILDTHFEGKASEESWQLLTAQRFLTKRWGLAELTAEETLRRYSKLGLPYGILGYAAVSRGANDEAIALFDKASELGWPQAQLGSVLYYGRQRRYELARSALKRSLEQGALKGHADTESLARELVGAP